MKIIYNKKLNKNKTKRYPNLGTVLMVEKYLEKNKSYPLKISEIKKGLPKQIMHQTLKITLEYLWQSSKIIYGPKGIQWIYTNSNEMDKLLSKSVEF